MIIATLRDLARTLRCTTEQAEDVVRDERSARASFARRGLFRAAGAVAGGLCSRYLLSAPVKIDLRGQVAEARARKKAGGGAPTVQFLVRGHWRNQAWGPRASLRRATWIQPFWKGPEDSRILLRNYQVPEAVETEKP